MDFKLSEEQNLLIDTTNSFVKNELMQHENLLEKTNNLPKELYDEIKKKSREVGLYACNMPKEHGGGLWRSALAVHVDRPAHRDSRVLLWASQR